MAMNLTEISILSVSAVTTNLVNTAFPKDSRNTVRIIEIVGGLATSQLSKKSNTKAAGVGVLTGALISFINDLFGIGKTGTQSVSSRYNTQQYPVGYNMGQFKSCPSCNER